MKQQRPGALTRFIIVNDPGPLSEVEDICFETDLASLARQIRGGFDPEGRDSNAVIYIDPVAALDDAQARIRARKTYDEALRIARGDVAEEEA